VQSMDRVIEATRLWLEVADRFRDPELGLVWVDRPHGRARADQAARLHSVAQDGLLYVLALLTLDQRVDEALRGIDSALRCQDTDPNSASYGNYRWYYEDDRVMDGNGGFFTNQLLLTIYFHHRDRLGDRRCQRLVESFRHSLAHFSERLQSVSYTNSVLGRIACGAVLAEMLGDDQALSRTRDAWDLFYRRNLTCGIPERLSPTYYGVSLPVLAMVLGHVRDRRIRWVAREVFDVLFQELCFFEHRIPMPNRRSYNAHGEACHCYPMAWTLGLKSITQTPLSHWVILW